MGDERNRPTGQRGGSRTNQEQLTPYARGWPAYVDAGWRGVLPLPPRAKSDPPGGYTGRKHWGKYPTREQMAAWAENPYVGNVALRLPPDVLGIDVDSYADKPGAETLAKLEAQHGLLPGTWTSTSRDDGISGIYLFKVPPGLTWRNQPGIEMLHHGHRYAMVWPSVHPEGRQYRWIDPDGSLLVDTVPLLDELPELPAVWVEGLTVSHRHEFGMTRHLDWLTDGEPCQAMEKVLARYNDHRAEMLRGQLQVLRHGEQGHRGARGAMDTLESRYLALDHHQQQDWDTALDGAVAIILHQGLTPEAERRCCRRRLRSAAEILGRPL
jgi:hypothetical protein